MLDPGFRTKAIGRKAKLQATRICSRIHKDPRFESKVVRETTSTASNLKMSFPYTFNISITSDTLCAWCYIHHSRLSKAIRLYSKTYCSADRFSIQYYPYLLQPQLTRTSRPRSDAFLERFGADRAKTITQMMDRIAQGDGITFSKGGRIGDSRPSHRIITFVGKENPECQSAVVGEIMKWHFESDGDITDEDALVDIAVNTGGLERQSVLDALANEDLANEVDMQATEARDKGINGVPHMLINGTVIEGAEDVEDIFLTLISIKEKPESMATRTNHGEANSRCSDGICS